MKYSYNKKQNISFQDHYGQHPPKVKYSLPGPPHPPKVKYFLNNSVPKLVIRRVGDTAYDSYIAETLYPLKSAIKLKKQTRFAGDPVSSVKTIPARRTRSHPPKWNIEAEDPDLLIPIELSQARADSDLIQDLGGDLSVVSPRKSHQSEETLPTVPLGQFQAQRSDNTTTNNIAHSNTDTPSQSEKTVYSATQEMAIIHRTMHDAIHAVREQQGRAVTRSLLNQQKAIAASKLQCNIQIKRTSTPEHPPMSNVPPRRARARSEKANGVTSDSSEESDCEPQTSRMAQFQTLKRLFETPTKPEEEIPSHGTFKRQRLFRKTTSQSAPDCPSNEYRTPGPS